MPITAPSFGEPRDPKRQRPDMEQRVSVSVLSAATDARRKRHLAAAAAGLVGQGAPVRAGCQRVKETRVIAGRGAAVKQKGYQRRGVNRGHRPALARQSDCKM